MTLPSPPLCVLLLGSTLADAQVSALRDVACLSVVRASGAKRPDLVLLALGDGASEAAALSQWRAEAPGVPGLAWAPQGLIDAQAALAAGLRQWWPAWPEARHLRAQIDFALAGAAREADLQQRLDERKWTERAKGVLMSGLELDEAGAFRLLRDTAMHTHLRLGEVARGLVEAAGLAEALNLAGQQRMLSQRLVKLLAQRAAGIERHRAGALLDESRARVDANLARLQTTLSAQLQPSLATVDAAWLDLRALLVPKPTPASLRAADEAADRLLDCSEQLATAIELAGAGRPLRLVNLCGRQRMLSQRLGKEALLAGLMPERGAQMAAALDAFESGLQELEAAPLSSPPLRAALAEVREEWRRLLAGLRQGGADPTSLARSSEELLGQLDALTQQIQQSLQVILG